MDNAEKKSNLLENLFGADSIAVRSTHSGALSSERRRTALDQLLDDELLTAPSRRPVSRVQSRAVNSSIAFSERPETAPVFPQRSALAGSGGDKPLEKLNQHSLHSNHSTSGRDIPDSDAAGAGIESSPGQIQLPHDDQRSIAEHTRRAENGDKSAQQPSWMLKLGLVSQSVGSTAEIPAANSPAPVDSTRQSSTVERTSTTATFGSEDLKKLVDAFTSQNAEQFTIFKEFLSNWRFQADTGAGRSKEEALRAEISQLKRKCFQLQLRASHSEVAISKDCEESIAEVNDICCQLESTSDRLKEQISEPLKLAKDTEIEHWIEMQRSSEKLVQEIDSYLASLSQRFVSLADSWNTIRQHDNETITNLRAEVSQLNDQKALLQQTLDENNQLNRLLNSKNAEICSLREELKSCQSGVSIREESLQRQSALLSAQREELNSRIQSCRDQLVAEQTRWLYLVQEARLYTATKLCLRSADSRTHVHKETLNTDPRPPQSLSELDGAYSALLEEKQLLQQQRHLLDQQQKQSIEEIGHRNGLLNKEKRRLARKWRLCELKSSEVNSLIKTAESIKREGESCLLESRHSLTAITDQQRQLSLCRSQLSQQQHSLSRDRLRLAAEQRRAPVASSDLSERRF